MTAETMPSLSMRSRESCIEALAQPKGILHKIPNSTNSAGSARLPRTGVLISGRQPVLHPARVLQMGDYKVMDAHALCAFNFFECIFWSFRGAWH